MLRQSRQPPSQTTERRGVTSSLHHPTPDFSASQGRPETADERRGKAMLQQQRLLLRQTTSLADQTAAVRVRNRRSDKSRRQLAKSSDGCDRDGDHNRGTRLAFRLLLKRVSGFPLSRPRRIFIASSEPRRPG